MPDEKRQAPGPAGGKVELSTMSQTKENWWDKAKPYVEITGVVLLAIYTGYTIKMYYANRTSADAAASAADTARKTLESSDQSFKTEQRAYLYTTSTIMTVVKHPPFCEIPGFKGKRLCVDVHFINGGKTPAIGTRTHRRVIVADDDSAEHTIKAFDIPSYTPAGSTTGAGVDSFVTAVTEELTDAQIKGWTAGTEFVYVYGVIEYSDLFDQVHNTGFCLKRLPGGAFEYCEYRNWLDRRKNQ